MSVIAIFYLSQKRKSKNCSTLCNALLFWISQYTTTCNQTAGLTTLLQSPHIYLLFNCSHCKRFCQVINTCCVLVCAQVSILYNTYVIYKSLFYLNVSHHCLHCNFSQGAFGKLTDDQLMVCICVRTKTSFVLFGWRGTVHHVACTRGFLDCQSRISWAADWTKSCCSISSYIG